MSEKKDKHLEALREMSAEEVMTYEFPPLETVAGREFVETKDGFHHYNKKVTKGHGEMELVAEMRVPATIETAIEEGIEFWGAVQRRILDDKANEIRRTELITQEEKKEKAQKQKKNLQTILEGLSPEEREAIKKSL